MGGDPGRGVVRPGTRRRTACERFLPPTAGGEASTPRRGVSRVRTRLCGLCWRRPQCFSFSWITHPVTAAALVVLATRVRCLAEAGDMCLGTPVQNHGVWLKLVYCGSQV